MSINDFVQELEDLARQALFEAKALEACQFHPEVTINRGDPEAEKYAYALATSRLKKSDRMDIREDLMDTIKNELDMAADGSCPACDGLRDS